MRRALLAFVVLDVAYRYAGPRAALRRAVGMTPHTTTERFGR